MKNILAGLCLIFLSACSLKNAVPLPTAFRFPKNFQALQVLKIHRGLVTKTFLANLERKGNDYDLSLLEPAFQHPLLRLSRQGPQKAQAQYFIPKERLPFNALFILDSVIELHSAKSFQTKTAALFHQGAIFDYQLRNFNKLWTGENCIYPENILMRPRASKLANAKTPEDLQSISLAIETKDLKCLP